MTFSVLTDLQVHLLFILRQEGLVAIPIAQFSNLPFIPAGDFSEIAGNPGDTIHIFRAAVSTGWSKAPARSMTEVTGRKLRGEGDLIIVSVLKGFDDKVGQ